MKEILDTGDEAAEDVPEVAEEETAEDTETGEDSESESDADGEGAAEEGGGEDSKDDEEIVDDAEGEVPTRKPRTNADFVAMRRKQKLDKQNAAKAEQGGDNDDFDEGDDEDAVSEEDAKIIDQRIDKRMAPIEEASTVAAVKTEIDDFVVKNPDFKPFAEKAVKWAKHPSYKDLPTEQLMYAAAGSKMLKMGAQRAKNVAIKTQKTKTGTGASGNADSSKKVADMTDEEFAQDVQNVKLGRK